MSTEDRLRDALQAEASRVQPRDRWAEIESQVLAPGMARPNRLAILSAAAAVAVVAASIALVSRDDPTTKRVLTDNPTSSSSALPPITTVPAVATTFPPTTIPASGPPNYIWPFDNETAYNTPIALANAFARDFIGMPDPRLGTFRSGDNSSGEIDVVPYETGGPKTTLSVRQDTNGWHVIDAQSGNLELDAPAHDARISSPVRLTGRSVAYEGTVRVAVLRYGTTMRCVQPTDSCGSDHGVLANTFFTGGGGNEKMAFSTEVTFNRSSTKYGLVILFTDSARDGTVAEATVRIVRFS